MLTRTWENYSQQPIEDSQSVRLQGSDWGIWTLFTPLSVGPVGKCFHIILQFPDLICVPFFGPCRAVESGP